VWKIDLELGTGIGETRELGLPGSLAPQFPILATFAA